MMITEPISPTGSLPAFESTLVIAFPDVLLAGPKILLSSTSGQATQTIAEWSHFCSPPPSRKKKAPLSGYATKPKDQNPHKIVYSTTTTKTAGGSTGYLTVVVPPPTAEQASLLGQAIVEQARASGTRRIVIVAAANVAGSKSSETHVAQLHSTEGALGLASLPRDAALNDHFLNTLLALLAFIEIPTTILVHPAKKGTNVRDTRSILDNLSTALASTLGGSIGLGEFSAERAFHQKVSHADNEASAESMMYL